MTHLKHWIAGATLLCCFWACGGGPEYATVDQFFRSAQSDDQPTLASMSAVGPPGEIQEWKVVEVSSRTTEPFVLPGLVEEFQAAEAERAAVLEEGSKYMEEEVEALDRILPRLKEDPEYKFSGRLGEIQEEWLQLVETRREKERVYQELRREVDAETRLVSKSVMNRGLTHAELEGDVAVTELLMGLTPKDGTEELPFKVKLHKYDLSAPASDRIEPARWIIVDIEGADEKARAYAEAERAGGPLARAAGEDEPSEADDDAGAAESAETVQSTMTYRPKELRGLARVQILTPETEIQGNDVVSKIQVRNSSRDWITRFTATEYWYDEAGTATRGGSKTHEARFMPGEVIELELRTGKNDNFFQNQFEFSHANGEVNATVVAGFPQSE